MRTPSGVALSLAVLLSVHEGWANPPASAPPPDPLPPGVSAVLWKVSVPASAAPTPEKVALGEKLFNDKRLSLDDSVSCATCHDPNKGFTDGKTVSEGVKGLKGMRNSPTVLNALFNGSQFWDGRAATLEDQAKLPILNPVEMAMPTPEAVVVKVRAIPEYATTFQQVFKRDVTYDDLAAAIAAFERTQFSGSARFDRFIFGESKALTDTERRGWALFNGKARCNACHAGNAVNPLFSDQKFHNIGVAAHKQDFPQLAREGLKVVRLGDEKQIDELALQTRFSELGRFLVTKQENDVGAFKTPTLRNIGITGPYMHDGSLVTLWDVIDHYNKGGVANPFLDGGMQRLGLTEAEIDDLVSFLFTLTDERFAKFNTQELARQRARKGQRPERDTAVAMGKKGNLGDLAPNPDLAVKNPADIGVYGTETLAKPASTKQP
ncbi:cytochrome-c peroxidase [Myxococcus sp. K15C18031901]|uniref:cytochrome-c peroxidase n=1 Tax=Myxococcus dinghuensis TaxID=2906761 RepID=UPI0020A7F89F|nr:cytochrome c peroxidase [Myxococcus dinghuensis]MCP3099775.1 cytochrome-c peroxidase [Myxococcus dinghuensis]